MGYGALANEWDAEELQEWGVDLPVFADQDFSGKNKEIDTDEMDDEMKIVLNYSSAEYWEVKNKLAEISDTPESAILKLLADG